MEQGAGGEVGILSFTLDQMNHESCCCRVAEACPTLATPWTVAHQAPLSTGFPRQEYRSG